MTLIAVLPLTLEKKVNIYQGSNGKYYNIEDIKESPKPLFPTYYDIHYPLDWIFDENYSYDEGNHYITGPLHCQFCKEQGYYNGVFIGYCDVCAAEFKDGERGYGINILNNNIVDLDKENTNSIWNTYLKNVDLNEIGDLNLNEERELYKDMPDLMSYSSDECTKTLEYDEILDLEYDDNSSLDELEE
jgi:hypothetical protein